MIFKTILSSHFVRYPSMQIQDLYKLIHQAAMGSEHAISNPEGVHKWMERELSEMGTGSDEPRIDPISDDGQIVRIHLRPFIAEGGDPVKLLDAFIQTAKEFRGDTQILRKYWNIATSMKYYSSNEMDDFIGSMQTQNYPAVHHSSKYESFYRPSYRVVWQKFI